MKKTRGALAFAVLIALPAVAAAQARVPAWTDPKDAEKVLARQAELEHKVETKLFRARAAMGRAGRSVIKFFAPPPSRTFRDELTGLETYGHGSDETPW